MVLLYKWIITIVIAAAVAVAAFVVPVAMADNGNGDNPGPFAGCLNGGTIHEGEDASPLLLWFPSAEPFPFVVDEFIVKAFRVFIERGNGVGTFVVPDEEGNIVTDVNTITEGACEAPGQVFSDRDFWLCYSTGYPWVGPRAQAIKLYDDGKGWKVPIAVKDDKANGPHIGNGITLSCNFSAYKVVEGVAVSTGGGEQYSGPYGDVEYKLEFMPLDYTVLGVPS
ncbi:hypothetical protein HYU82_02395 [Candidatus Saccharibacteria bacterium]|nr:hypothetical protein [Candidatus Saccharibacteria bacterium]